MRNFSYEEALDVINSSNPFMSNRSASEQSTYMQILIKALRKQIAEYPIVQKDKYTCSCGLTKDYDKIPSNKFYCEKCGQLLDFSFYSGLDLSRNNN